ncbi:MAG: winged helix-turn-helix transcriptional regulator [Saprospiraceae bacterium]|nr:winged helix-turn-helix transcriptional regulator [Saprospiraceae bacterium]
MRRDPWQALADPTRREIIQVLEQGPLTINSVAEKFRISRPAVSKQIKILHECGLIEVDSVGRERICTLTPGPLVEVFAWVKHYEHFWLGKLDKLGEFLDQEQDITPGKRPNRLPGIKHN